MANSSHRILAALFGAVVLAGAVPRADDGRRTCADASAEHQHASDSTAPASRIEPRAGVAQPLAETDEQAPASALQTRFASESPATLGALLEARARLAADAGRRAEIERLGTLWLTLARRGELDRVVSRGEGFVSVALRNQEVSMHRAELRQRRFVATESEALGVLAEASGPAQLTLARADRADDRVAAEELLGRLEEPYRTAVDLSLQGLNRREVAEHMGVAHATVRKWMQRLRQRLLDEGELAA
jgi:DNA-directed RNA polymerase specialized sigma24 family protein